MDADLTEKLLEMSGSLSKFGDPRHALVEQAAAEIKRLREENDRLEIAAESWQHESQYGWERF